MYSPRERDIHLGVPMRVCSVVRTCISSGLFYRHNVMIVLSHFVPALTYTAHSCGAGYFVFVKAHLFPILIIV